MSRLCLGIAIAFGIFAPHGQAQQAPAAGPYKVLKTAKVGGAGGFDYVNVDVEARRLYIARTGATPRITVFNLDTLEPVGQVPTTNAHGAAIDPKTNHGFATSKPIVMFDTKTLAPIKTIDVQGNPDGSLFDPSNQRAYILSHASPHVTVIDAKDGAVVGTFDIGGMPEQAVSDGKGRLYIDVEDKENSPSSFVVEQTLQTMPGARTSALDTKTNHIILIAAEFGPPTPPAQPGGRAGRGAIVADSFSILVVGK